MNKIKKLFIIPILLFVALVTVGCKKEEVKLTVLAPEGIPCVALGGLFNDDNYTITTVAGPDLLKADLVKGDNEIIIAPIVLGATLYTKGASDKYKLVSTLTLGNSYLVCREKDKIDSLKELEGKKVASYGANTAPDIVLKKALSVAGVDLSKVEFVHEASVADAFTNQFMPNNDVNYVLSAEPIITKMTIKKFNTPENKLVSIDLQEILKDELTVIPQAGIFVRADLDKDISSFVKKIKNNVKELNKKPAEYASKLMALNNDIFNNLGEEVIKRSIPGSNIEFMEAKTNKTILDKYFSMIREYNPNILGAKEVDEAFYY